MDNTVKLLIESALGEDTIAGVVQRHFKTHGAMMPDREDYSWHDTGIDGARGYGHPVTHDEVSKEFKSGAYGVEAHKISPAHNVARLYAPDRLLIHNTTTGEKKVHHLDHPARSITYQLHQAVIHPVSGKDLYTAKIGEPLTVTRKHGESIEQFASRAHKEHERVHNSMGIHGGMDEDAPHDQKAYPDTITKPAAWLWGGAEHNVIHSSEAVHEYDDGEDATIGMHYTHLTDHTGKIHENSAALQHYATMVWNK